MGQRLIISEEERSRISGMYGLVNEEVSEQKDDPNTPSTEKGYKVGPINASGHLKGIAFDVSERQLGTAKIKIKSELRQSEALNILEFDYSFVPSESSDDVFVAPARYNCTTKDLYLPYDMEGGKKGRNYEIDEKYQYMLSKF